MDFTGLSQKINESRPLNFGSVFNNSIALFKKVWLEGFITLLFTFLSILPFYILLYVPMLGFGIMDPQAIQNEEIPPELAILMFLLMPVILFGIATCGLCLNAAFMRICRLKDLKEPGDNNYFFYFKKEYLVKALILSLITFGLSILGFMACGLGIFYLIVPLSLFPVFLAFDEELNAIEITKASFALGNKN